jgi:hypothetical protein
VLGVIWKPNVPVAKQVNLYQNGFLSEKGPRGQGGAGMLLPPQNGTVVCEKTEVPQTGKAVAGFCPSAVQICDFPCASIEKQKANSNSIFFIISAAKLL